MLVLLRLVCIVVPQNLRMENTTVEQPGSPNANQLSDKFMGIHLEQIVLGLSCMLIVLMAVSTMCMIMSQFPLWFMVVRFMLGNALVFAYAGVIGSVQTQDRKLFKLSLSAAALISSMILSLPLFLYLTSVDFIKDQPKSKILTAFMFNVPGYVNFFCQGALLKASVSYAAAHMVPRTPPTDQIQ